MMDISAHIKSEITIITFRQLSFRYTVLTTIIYHNNILYILVLCIRYNYTMHTIKNYLKSLKIF